MAELYATQMTKVNAGTTPDPGFVDGTRRQFIESLTYAAQGTTDTVAIARLPKGAIVTGGRIMTSVTTATATMAIGITGTTGKYRAAAAFTTTDTWEELGIDTTTFNVALTAEEEVIITIGTAALPASGTLLVQFDYVFD